MKIADHIPHQWREIWAEGARHGFHRCCRARYIVDSALLPTTGVVGRLARLFPRRAVADGCVPCEFHVLKWLATGDRSSWRHRPDDDGSMCCEGRRDLEHSAVHIRSDRIVAEDFPTVDFGGDPNPIVYWLDIAGEAVSVAYCPWCGKKLGER